MARLDNKCKKSLEQADFDQYPVWVWDDEHSLHCPIDELEPDLDDYWGPFFVKARFTVGSFLVDGYLVGGPSFYAFILFVAGREFSFNLNLPDLIEQALPEFYRALGIEPTPLFPLLFESDVRLKNCG